MCDSIKYDGGLFRKYVPSRVNYTPICRLSGSTTNDVARVHYNNIRYKIYSGVLTVFGERYDFQNFAVSRKNL